MCTVVEKEDESLIAYLVVKESGDEDPAMAMWRSYDLQGYHDYLNTLEAKATTIPIQEMHLQEDVAQEAMRFPCLLKMRQNLSKKYMRL